MHKNNFTGFLLAGCAAGAVNGLLGAGGGMVLVPLLCMLTALEDREIFNASVAIILPICVISIIVTGMYHKIPWETALPYLIGSAVGGTFAAVWGHKIPVTWLHRSLGILIIWGGIRYLC